MVFSLLTLFPVPNISDTDIFFRYQIFPIPIPRLFSGTKFFRYRYFFRYQIFLIPIPRLFSGIKFFRYQSFFPVPIFSDTDTTKKRKFPVPVRHTLGEKSNKCNQCDYASSEAGHLRRHLKTHSREKSYKAGNLRRHSKTHSGEVAYMQSV